MSPPERADPRTGQGARAEVQAGGPDTTKDTAPATVADGYRLALAVAGLDPIPLGVRPVGPLTWTPTEDDCSRVADARRRELARRRLRDLEREARACRVTGWLEVAA